MKAPTALVLLTLATLAAPLRAETPVLIAEYEPLRGILVSWDGEFRVPMSFLVEASRRGDLWCMVREGASRAGALEALGEAGVSGDKVHVVVADFSGPWPRDYGPFFVRRDGRVVAVDFLYDRPRTADDAAPRAIAAALGYVYDFVPLVHTGGNLERNARGVAISTSLVLRENRYDLARVRSFARDRLGVTRYLVYDDPTSSYHEHANCWVKFVSDQDIAILDVPPDHPWHEDLVAVRLALEAEGYTVHPIPAPGASTYLNALILNGAVFVPTRGEPGHDALALAAWRAAAPDMEVIEVAWDRWLPTDALACRVLAIP